MTDSQKPVLPDPSRSRLLAGIATSTASAAALAACGGSAALPRATGATAAAGAAPTSTPDAPDNGAPASSTSTGSTGSSTTAPSGGSASGSGATAGGSTATPTSGNSGSSGASGGSMPTPTTGGGTTGMPMPTPSSLPANPADSGIDHIVVLMMENRSFDHMLGWLPGANGVQADTTNYPDTSGKNFNTYHLKSYQSCGSADPDHSYEGGRKHYNNGKMDGFLQTSPAGDPFPIGYFTGDDVPFFKQAAANFTVCDKYHSGILSATYPNRMYMHTGQTDRNTNTSTNSTLPAIWDMLSAKGVSGTYFFNDLPLTALFGNRFLSISKPLTEFLALAKAGQLPSVSYVDPYFGGEGNGVSKDDHPLADIRDGQAYMTEIYQALSSSPNWSKTLFIINYDEWGGFRDHVAPPTAPVSVAEQMIGNKDGLLGFRVPCVLIGPRAKKGYIEKRQWDPNSILNFICWRFGLDTLGVRAATSGNIGEALDFTNTPRTDIPSITMGMGPYGLECDVSTHLPAGVALSDLSVADRSKAEHLLELQSLRVVARRYGFNWTTAN